MPGLMTIDRRPVSSVGAFSHGGRTSTRPPNVLRAKCRFQFCVQTFGSSSAMRGSPHPRTATASRAASIWLRSSAGWSVSSSSASTTTTTSLSSRWSRTSTPPKPAKSSSADASSMSSDGTGIAISNQRLVKRMSSWDVAGHSGWPRSRGTVAEGRAHYDARRVAASVAGVAPEAAVLAIGHRGAAGHMPENTMPSFEKALELGADALEFDVALTRDGVPVVIHDDTLDRTTDGRGPVEQSTFEEISRLDAGSW